MKEKKLYECDYCHTSYSDRDDAYKCEKNHKKLGSICNPRYVSVNSDRTGRPITVEVVFTDGTKAIYKR